METNLTLLELRFFLIEAPALLDGEQVALMHVEYNSSFALFGMSLFSSPFFYFQRKHTKRQTDMYNNNTLSRHDSEAKETIPV